MGARLQGPLRNPINLVIFVLRHGNLAEQVTTLQMAARYPRQARV
jgi:hypothetical protein